MLLTVSRRVVINLESGSSKLCDSQILGLAEFKNDNFSHFGKVISCRLYD